MTLKPCPFCGSEASPATVQYHRDTVREQPWKQDTFHYVNCVRCGSKNLGLVGFETPEIAATHWNRRVVIE